MSIVCKPYSKDLPGSGFCFSSLLAKVLGGPFDDCCLKCFAQLDGIDAHDQQEAGA